MINARANATSGCPVSHSCCRERLKIKRANVQMKFEFVQRAVCCFILEVKVLQNTTYTWTSLQHVGLKIIHWGWDKMVNICRWHFAFFRCEDCCIFNQILLNTAPTDSVIHMPALVQIMAWRQTDDKPLSRPTMALSTDAYMCPSVLISPFCIEQLSREIKEVYLNHLSFLNEDHSCVIALLENNHYVLRNNKKKGSAFVLYN